MRYFINTLLFFVLTQLAFGQSKLDKTLKKFNSEKVEYIRVDEMPELEQIVLLDTRKKEEFYVSHLKNAIWVGYEAFEEARVLAQVPNKDTPIVVYCSIGVRSENIGEKLQELGYTDVKNLYGGIFEWKNQNHTVYNTNEVATDSVHAFDKHWGKLLHKGTKVYKAPAFVERID